MINGHHGEGNHCTKKSADSLAKIPQMPQNLSAQFVFPSCKVLDFNEKKASLGVRSPCFGPCSKAKQEGGVNLSEPVVRSSTRMSKGYSR